MIKRKDALEQAALELSEANKPLVILRDERKDLLVEQRKKIGALGLSMRGVYLERMLFDIPI